MYYFFYFKIHLKFKKKLLFLPELKYFFFSLKCLKVYYERMFPKRILIINQIYVRKYVFFYYIINNCLSWKTILFLFPFCELKHKRKKVYILQKERQKALQNLFLEEIILRECTYRRKNIISKNYTYVQFSKMWNFQRIKNSKVCVYNKN